jgi:hypothetical protein
MPEYIANVTHSTPKDLTIVELTATIDDQGVKIHAKSPILADFVAAKQNGILPGGEYVNAWKGMEIYNLPSRIVQEMTGSNGIYPDMFLSTRNDLDGNRVLVPNLVWMRVKGLAEGVTLVFPQPAHVPADLVEYLNRSMDKTRIFYQRFVRKVSITANLIERE